MQKITIYNKYIEEIDTYPDICPHYHKYQVPMYVGGLKYEGSYGEEIIEVFFNIQALIVIKGL